MAQEVEQIVSFLEDQWFDPRFLQSLCPSVLGHDTEHQIALSGFVMGV